MGKLHICNSPSNGDGKSGRSLTKERRETVNEATLTFCTQLSSLQFIHSESMTRMVCG